MTNLRKRARQACQACNARRIKCNVTEQKPCRNCATADTPCELRESRRGKHPRPSRRSQKPDNAAGLDQVESSPSFIDTSLLDDSVGNEDDEHFAASQALADLARHREIEGPEEQEGITVQPQSPPLAPNTRQEDDSSVFLGESSSIRYVTNSNPTPSIAGISPPENLRFLHAVPHAVRAENLIPEWEVERRRSRIRSLKAEGVFSFPPGPAVETLLKAYFQWFHPCFPVVDEVDIWTSFRDGTSSPLLLQAILFIAVIHCEEDAVPPLGLGGRHVAKWVFYNRAKDIYDVEFEPKKFTVTQALFLMSFWRAGLLLEKDARHWLGAAISLAQTRALHRSSRSATTEKKTERLYRRLWWAIYIRERQCAAALGLPNRIRDEDCDIETLQEVDFERAFDAALLSHKAQEYIAYFIGIAQLSRVLGRIVHSGYLPSKSLSASDRSRMKDDLVRWRKGLPTTMCLGNNDFGDAPGFHASMLHLAYNNLLILLYRSGCIGSAEESKEVDGQIALQAAARNSRIIEDMLLEGHLRHGQIHVITNLFNTLCIHTVHLRSSKGPGRSIIEHRAKLCLLGLQELQKTWEVRMWVLQLFFQYLDRSTAARLRMQDEIGFAPGLDSVQDVGTGPKAMSGLNRGVVERDGSDGLDTLLASEPPWSWSTEEANQFLFTQIENDFAFGEGGVLNWNADTPATILPSADSDSPMAVGF
ncbi:cutinase transcription factor 1 alpha [Colletotrichum orchidophilum]|uniref:Cutinase transcription factor 1 alpha n=1 Tax=Colletotrichum orchidophilum TaxID=1209926 RepID=A0A1G4B9D7_9PEZI|nr:cutinase transcription factor 1 alpha [Colletotrichum orchidophilum]OHE97892.1 cutinase transcription factor 1 alpha [Colletotrichum orchidophilum]